MKKHLSLFAFITFVFLFLLSLFLALICVNLKKDFFVSAGCFFIAGLMFIEAKLALQPIKKWGLANTVKALFHKFNKPQLYRNFCLIHMVVFFLIAVTSFVKNLLVLIGS